MIRSPDTDVEVLSLHHQANISAALYLEVGGLQNKRVVNIRDVSAELGPTFCSALPGMHAITGCDSVSAFSGKGKRLAADLVMGNDTIAQSLADLGTDVPPREDQMAGIEHFVCQLYKAQTLSINEARYLIFCKMKNKFFIGY